MHTGEQCKLLCFERQRIEFFKQFELARLHAELKTREFPLLSDHHQDETRAHLGITQHMCTYSALHWNGPVGEVQSGATRMRLKDRSKLEIKNVKTLFRARLPLANPANSARFRRIRGRMFRQSKFCIVQFAQGGWPT